MMADVAVYAYSHISQLEALWMQMPLSSAVILRMDTIKLLAKPAVFK